MSTVRRKKKPLVTLLVPVFNEAEAIDLFCSVTQEVMERSGCPYELIFIDDGSGDETVEVLKKAKAANGRIAIIQLSRNFGKEAALTAGIDHAKGDVVVPLDVDLQDPPELILDFLDKWREGYDVVYGVRTERKGDNAAKRFTAGLFYRVFNKLSGTAIPANAGDFRLMDRRVVEEVKQLRERTRFMKGLMAWPGFKSCPVPFERPERAIGETSWNYPRLINFALDGITSFSTTPLRALIYFGAGVAFLAFCFALYIIIDKVIWGNDVQGYPSLIVSVAFFSGIQILSLGVIGEYIGRLFHEVKQRPIYIVEDIDESDLKAPRTSKPPKPPKAPKAK